MQASIDNSIQCLSSLVTNFERLVCRYTSETHHIHDIHELREFRSMDKPEVRANNIRVIVDVQDKLERARVHLDLFQRRIHNLSSNLVILPTEIIQEILVLGMPETPNLGNERYLRTITRTSHQLREAALSCSDLWVHLKTDWGRLQGRPAELHVIVPENMESRIRLFRHLMELELSTLPMETVHLSGSGPKPWSLILNSLHKAIPQVTDVRRLRIRGKFKENFPLVFPKVHDLEVATAYFVPDIFLGNWHLRHLKFSHDAPSQAVRPLLVEQSMSLESLQLNIPFDSYECCIKPIDFPNLRQLVLVELQRSNRGGYGVLTMFRAPNLVHAKLVTKFDPMERQSPPVKDAVDTFVSNSHSFSHVFTS